MTRCEAEEILDQAGVLVEGAERRAVLAVVRHLAFVCRQEQIPEDRNRPPAKTRQIKEALSSLKRALHRIERVQPVGALHEEVRAFRMRIEGEQVEPRPSKRPVHLWKRYAADRPGRPGPLREAGLTRDDAVAVVRTIESFCEMHTRPTSACCSTYIPPGSPHQPDEHK